MNGTVKVGTVKVGTVRVGVEEEFLLVDDATGRPAPRIHEVSP